MRVGPLPKQDGPTAHGTGTCRSAPSCVPLGQQRHWGQGKLYLQWTAKLNHLYYRPFNNYFLPNIIHVYIKPHIQQLLRIILHNLAENYICKFHGCISNHGKQVDFFVVTMHTEPEVRLWRKCQKGPSLQKKVQYIKI